jgi:hypothetical protein
MSGLLLTEVERTDQPWRRLLLPPLKARQASVEAWHQRLWSGLESARKIFDELGVEVAIAKGIAAEARWYSRLGERPCNDLDLLLSPTQLDRIDDIIAAIEPSHPLCGKTFQLAKRGFLQSIDLKHEGVPIDLHWDIFKIGIPSRNLDEIWERTVTFSLPSGSSLRALDPETSFVHFLVHLNKDKFRRLLGFVDPARISHQEELDGEAVERLVRVDGIKTCVDASWNVVVDTLDLAAPRRTPTPGIRAVLWKLAWAPSVRLTAEDSRVRFRHRQYLIALLSPGRTTEAVQRWIRGRFPPQELLAYVHPEYAARWGGDSVTKTPHSWLWSLTVGRVKALIARRLRDARTAQMAGGKSRNKQGPSREPEHKAPVWARLQAWSGRGRSSL